MCSSSDSGEAMYEHGGVRGGSDCEGFLEEVALDLSLQDLLDREEKATAGGGTKGSEEAEQGEWTACRRAGSQCQMLG